MSLFSVGSDVLFIEALCYNNNNSYYIYIYTNNPLWGLHSKNDYVKMTHFVKMTYCQDNKVMLLIHTSSYYNKVMLH